MKDNHSRRGLLALWCRSAAASLDYLKRKDEGRYRDPDRAARLAPLKS